MKKLAILTTVLVLCLGCMVSQSQPALAIGHGLQDLRYCCSTADPLGATYTDLGTHRTTRLMIAVIDSISAGPNGLFAVLSYDVNNILTLSIYRYGKKARAIQIHYDQTQLLGWIDDKLAFLDDKGTHQLEPETGRIVHSALPENTFKVFTLKDKILVVERSDSWSYGVVKLLDRNLRRLRVWKIPGWIGVVSLCNAKRIALHVSTIRGDDILDKPNRLVVIDYSHHGYRFMKTPPGAWGSSFSSSQGESEALMAVDTHHNETNEEAITIVELLDLKSFHRKKLFSTIGPVQPIDVTGDGRWLLALNIRHHPVGPVTLVAIDMRTGKQRFLQRDVYECGIVAK